MSLDYRFHLIYHAFCSGIFISQMLYEIVNKVRAIFRHIHTYVLFIDR